MTQTTLDQIFLDEQKKKLLADKDRLEKELQARGKAKENNPNDYAAQYQDYGDDEESNAAEYTQAEADNSIVEQLDDELARVAAALERITRGAYGIDTETGKPIRKERLQANPSAEVDI